MIMTVDELAEGGWSLPLGSVGPGSYVSHLRRGAWFLRRRMSLCCRQ